MFENEIKFISDFSLNKIKNLGSFVTFEKLSMSELHPALVTYISAELDYMIYRDRKKLLQDSIFDYTGREISDHFNVIASEIKKSKKISIDDIEKLILQAVSFNMNYVVRPKWSITKLIYNDQDFVSVDELDRMLNYLYYYDYIKSVLSAYISRRKVIQLTVTEFDLILNKIDRELFKSNTKELINNALHSISDMFNIGGIEKTRISLAAVEIFLKEKNLMDYLLKLRHAIPNRTKNKYEISDINKIFYSESTISPEMIADSPEKESFTDQKLSSKPEVFEEKIETIEFHDSEIVTEEKIKSKIGKDEPPADDIIIEEIPEEIIPESDVLEEDLLPIEEELTDMADKKKKPEITIEDSIIPEPEIDKAEIEAEIVIENENTLEEESKTGNDELLAFYEEELTSMEEEGIIIEETDDQPEITEENISAQTQEINEEISGEEKLLNNITEDKIEDAKEESVKGGIKDDDMDFSIFDDENAEKDFNEILSKVSADFHGDLSQTDDQKDDIVTPEDINSSVDSETEFDFDNSEDLVNDIDSVDLSAGKEIIDEMLDDYFGESDSLDKGSGEKSNEQSTDIVEDRISEVPEKPDDSDLPSESINKDVEENTDNSELGSDLTNEIPEDNSMEDISAMIDDIDDIIERSALDESESEIAEDKKMKDQQGELSLDEEFKPIDETLKGDDVKSDNESKIDDEVISEDEPVVDEIKPSEEGEEKVEDKIRGKEHTVREKDLFSYLSRKEVKKIVSNVFANDYEDFATTIEKISECMAYKHATEILKGVFFTYRISPYSKDAVILTNAVSHYFRQI